MLKNAKTEYWNEFEEIAIYTAIETLADTVGDKETVKLARGIRRRGGAHGEVPRGPDPAAGEERRPRGDPGRAVGDQRKLFAPQVQLVAQPFHGQPFLGWQGALVLPLARLVKSRRPARRVRSHRWDANRAASAIPRPAGPRPSRSASTATSRRCWASCASRSRACRCCSRSCSSCRSTSASRR